MAQTRERGREREKAEKIKGTAVEAVHSLLWQKLVRCFASLLSFAGTKERNFVFKVIFTKAVVGC